MGHYTVLGASGFIGSRLVKMLNLAGVDCYTPARCDHEVFERDLGRVFYCIGLTADYAQRPFDTVEAHVSHLARLLEKAKFKRLIYLSSTRLYDGLPGGSYLEGIDLVFNPSNERHIYDLSKALGENLCLTASGGRASIARLSCVYDDTPGSPGFLSELLHRLRTEREFTLDSASGVVRDYVAVGDVLAALKAILDSGRSEIFNVASGENVSNQDIVDTINEFDYRICLSRTSDRQNPAVSDISKVVELGVQPALMREYLRTFLKNRGCDESH